MLVNLSKPKTPTRRHISPVLDENLSAARLCCGSELPSVRQERRWEGELDLRVSALQPGAADGIQTRNNGEFEQLFLPERPQQQQQRAGGSPPAPVPAHHHHEQPPG